MGFVNADYLVIALVPNKFDMKHLQVEYDGTTNIAVLTVEAIEMVDASFFRLWCKNKLKRKRSQFRAPHEAKARKSKKSCDYCGSVYFTQNMCTALSWCMYVMNI